MATRFIDPALIEAGRHANSYAVHEPLTREVAAAIASRELLSTSDQHLLAEWRFELGDDGLAEWLTATPGLPRFTGYVLMVVQSVEEMARSRRFCDAADSLRNELPAEAQAFVERWPRIDGDTVADLGASISEALTRGALGEAADVAYVALQLLTATVPHILGSDDSREFVEIFAGYRSRIRQSLEDAQPELDRARSAALARG